MNLNLDEQFDLSRHTRSDRSQADVADALSKYIQAQNDWTSLEVLFASKNSVQSVEDVAQAIRLVGQAIDTGNHYKELAYDLVGNEDTYNYHAMAANVRLMHDQKDNLWIQLARLHKPRFDNDIVESFFRDGFAHFDIGHDLSIPVFTRIQSLHESQKFMEFALMYQPAIASASAIYEQAGVKANELAEYALNQVVPRRKYSIDTVMGLEIEERSQAAVDRQEPIVTYQQNVISFLNEYDTHQDVMVQWLPVMDTDSHGDLAADWVTFSSNLFDKGAALMLGAKVFAEELDQRPRLQKSVGEVAQAMYDLDDARDMLSAFTERESPALYR